MKDFIKDQDGRYRVRIKTKAGEVLATSEGYRSLADAEVGYADICGIVIADIMRSIIFWADVPEQVDVPPMDRAGAT